MFENVHISLPLTLMMLDLQVWTGISVCVCNFEMSSLIQTVLLFENICVWIFLCTLTEESLGGNPVFMLSVCIFNPADIHSGKAIIFDMHKLLLMKSCVGSHQRCWPTNLGPMTQGDSSPGHSVTNTFVFFTPEFQAVWMQAGSSLFGLRKEEQCQYLQPLACFAVYRGRCKFQFCFSFIVSSTLLG